MRELTATAVAVLFVTTLGIAVFALDDQQTAIAQSPAAVTEGLVHQLASRSEQTQQSLSTYARETNAPGALANWMADVERHTGTVTRVQAEDLSVGQNLAETTVSMRGSKGTTHARVSLIREAGLWRVERLDLVPQD